MNLKQQDQFYQMVSRLKANSRAASVPKEDAIVTEIVNGLIVSKPAKRIEYISEPASEAKTSSKAASTREIHIPIPGSSTGEPIYQCGTHDYETRSLKEFNEHIARSHNDNDTGSKAASASVSVPGINKVKAIHDFVRSNGRF